MQGQATPPLSDQAVPGCPNDVTIVDPDHPVVQGIMKSGLDNWTCSIHEAFNAFPAASLGVVVRDTPTALPYVIAGSSPKARLCVNEEEDRGNGEVEDENGGDGGDFDFDECDENHEFHHRDRDRNVDFHSTKKDDVPKFDLSVLKATSTGSGLNNGLPVTYTLVVTDLGIGPGTDLYSLTLRDGSGAIVYSRTGLLRLGDVVVREGPGRSRPAEHRVHGIREAERQRLVRLDDRIAQDRHGDRLARLAGRECELARRRGVVAACSGGPVGGGIGDRHLERGRLRKRHGEGEG